MPPSMSVEDFSHDYITTWSTEDDGERQRLIDQLYADDATFFADEPGDDPVERHGRAEIMQNITQVNERLTQRAGLATTQTGVVENHDVLRVSWQMTTADGTIALTGMNLLIRDDSGMITRDYIFIG